MYRTYFLVDFVINYVVSLQHKFGFTLCLLKATKTPIEDIQLLLIFS